MTSLSSVAAASLAACLLSVAPAAATEPGDLWETTTEMSMGGMSMPARTSRHCAPREWKEPPGGDQDNKCETSGFVTSGSTYSWKIRCAGPPVMAGEGEVTRTATGYSGWMKMKAPQGEMNMKITGRRIGDCDGGETKRQIAQIKDTAARAEASSTAAICAAAIQSMMLSMIDGPSAQCKIPEAKGQFCDRLRTEEGFEAASSAVGRQPGDSLEAATAYCGTSAEAVRAKLCQEAEKKESLEYLGKNCPAEAQTIAQRECAGRKYTELTGSKYQGFCGQYARDTLADPNAPADDSKKGKTKKLLKGIFNR